MTGGMDEEQIFAINQMFEYANNLFKRKEDVMQLTKRYVNDAQKINFKCKISKLSLYRPYKEKKKTKATEAVAKGLEPLANFLLSFPNTDVLAEAKKYINDEVATEQEALEGAGFI